jgi:hypothetical protein
MAKNTAPKSKSGNGVATDSASETPESLDQVRDILFGGQMRMVDARLRGLEERILHEQSALKTDFTRKLADLEGTTKKELASLAERLQSERAKRADELKALGSEFKDALKSLERRHQKLEEAAGLADADLRDQLFKQSAALSSELARTADRLSTELDRVGTTLRTEKLDTAALSAALTDMASRLNGNGRTAGKGAAKA